WSVGCATGEEPYGLAIVASEVIARSSPRPFLGVMASDICIEALQQARVGRFSSKRLKPLPTALRDRYFVNVGPSIYEVQSALRDRMCYAQVNLLEVDRLPPL